eukprot:s685_g11.t1
MCVEYHLNRKSSGLNCSIQAQAPKPLAALTTVGYSVTRMSWGHTWTHHKHAPSFWTRKRATDQRAVRSTRWTKLLGKAAGAMQQQHKKVEEANTLDRSLRVVFQGRAVGHGAGFLCKERSQTNELCTAPDAPSFFDRLQASPKTGDSVHGEGLGALLECTGSRRTATHVAAAWQSVSAATMRGQCRHPLPEPCSSSTRRWRRPTRWTGAYEWFSKAAQWSIFQGQTGHTNEPVNESWMRDVLFSSADLRHRAVAAQPHMWQQHGRAFPLPRCAANVDTLCLRARVMQQQHKKVEEANKLDRSSQVVFQSQTNEPVNGFFDLRRTLMDQAFEVNRFQGQWHCKWKRHRQVQRGQCRRPFPEGKGFGRPESLALEASGE